VFFPIAVSESLHESRSELRTVRVQLQEQQSLTPQIESERDGLSAEVVELKEVLQDLEKRLGAANSALNQLKADTERRLRDKDEELDIIR